MYKGTCKLSLVGAIAICACGTAGAETKLRYNQWVPQTHHSQSELMHPWFKQIAAATEGRVVIEPTGSALGATQAQLEMVENGVADVVFSIPSYTPSRFHLAHIGLLPFSGNRAEAVSVAYWRVTQAMSPKHDEYKGIKLLGLMVAGPGQVFNNKRDIRSIDDFRGLKLRASNTVTSSIAKAVGAVPIPAPAPRTYELLSNGVVDGDFSNADAFRSWKLERLLTYQTRFSGALFFDCFYIAMNRKKWESISKKDQAAIDALGGEAFARIGGRQWDLMNAKGEDVMRAANTKITMADAKFMTEIRARLKFIEDDWIKGAREKGVDGESSLSFMRAQAADYEKSMK